MNSRVLGITAVALGITVSGSASPAWAASTGRSDACVSWACGSATNTFQDAYTMNPVNTSIRDGSCNGSLAYVQLHVYYVGGGGTYTTKRYDNSTCDTSYRSFNGLSFSSSSRIAGFRVVVGDSVNGAREGTYVDNPYS